MAWVSPKVYAILMNSEEGKDILEGIVDKSQEQVDKEVDAFFGNGGKGHSSSKEYEEAKKSDKEQENNAKVEEKPNNRFSKEPTYEDYGIDKELAKQIEGLEGIKKPEDVEKTLNSYKRALNEEKWLPEDLKKSFNDRVAMLSNLKVNQFIKDGFAFNKQLKSDIEEFRDEATQKYIKKILSENDLYRYNSKTDFETKDDLLDDINNDFIKKYGYDKKMFLDKDTFEPTEGRYYKYYDNVETYNDGTKEWKKTKLNKDRIIGDLLNNGILTFADLKKLINGK